MARDQDSVPEHGRASCLPIISQENMASGDPSGGCREVALSKTSLDTLGG